MNRKDETIICTTCPITGGACLQGHALLTRLAAAIGAAGDTLDEEFEITGAADVAGCGRACRLAWRATRDEAWLAGDVDEDMPQDRVWAAARAGRGLVIATRRAEMILS
ncbi:hypothetical protein [Aliiroseovarius sp.]|uniref:hypothetical protein n=1 Tax=Aliiroseovarius sp. TaxID=1872442 RepID=UPI002614EC67|nr:hypothetical protein [Aliiroseovarius sp.]